MTRTQGKAGDPTRWAKPDQQPDDGHQGHDEGVAGQVGQRATRQDGQARHRQRPKAVDHPGGQVLGQADTGGRRTEDDGLHEDAGHQEVDVGDAARLDGPAEDVAKQEGEHDRLDEGEHQQLGLADQVKQVATGEDQRVADRPGQRRAFLGLQRFASPKVGCGRGNRRVGHEVASWGVSAVSSAA
jgi:hypothetical protein